MMDFLRDWWIVVSLVGLFGPFVLGMLWRMVRQ